MKAQQLTQLKQHKRIFSLQVLFSFLIIFGLCSFLFFVAAKTSVAIELPIGLQVAQEYNQQQAQSFLLNVSFLIAFIAGMLTLLSPCLLPLIPAFFSVVFKEKKQITMMTLVFFGGFTVMFLAMGVLATVLGQASLILLQDNYSLFIQIAGVVLILFGVMALAGHGFSGIILRKKTTHDTIGVFVYGMLFALGWTVCVGPILGGVLSMTALFHNYFNGIVLMFFYSLGMFVPVFLFSYFYDSHHLEKMKWMKGTVYHFSFNGKTHSLHTTNIISGVLFIILGFSFVLSKGTEIVNGWTYFGIKEWFYTLQRQLLEGRILYNVIGVIVLIVVIYIVYKGIKIDREEVQ